MTAWFKLLGSSKKHMLYDGGTELNEYYINNDY